MASLQQIEQIVEALVSEAGRIRADVETLACFPGLALNERAKLIGRVNREYNKWYCQARVLVGVNLAEQEEQFIDAYEGESQQDGSRWAYRGARMAVEDLIDTGKAKERIQLFRTKLDTQTGIIASIPSVVRLRAMGMKQLLAAELLEDELAAARHLLGNGFVRPAGAVTGVVLERHLKLMCEKRQIEIGEKETVGTLNNKLKDHYDEPANYQKVKWMAEVRAACDHDKQKEPAASDVGDLIEVVHKFISTVS